MSVVWVSLAGCRDGGVGLSLRDWGCLCVGQGMSIVWVSQAGCRGGGRVGGLSLCRAGHKCYVGVTGRL